MKVERTVTDEYEQNEQRRCVIHSKYYVSDGREDVIWPYWIDDLTLNPKSNMATGSLVWSR